MGTAKRERQKANRQQKLASQAVQDRHEQRRKGLLSFAVIVAVVVVIGGLLYLSSNKKSSNSASTTTTTPSSTTVSDKLVARTFTYGTTPCPPADGSATRTIDFKAPPKNCLTAGKSYTATFDTTAGKIVVDLDTTKTPGTANNFVFLADYHYYDDTKIFRANAGIDILQGGSPHSQDAGDAGPGYSLKDEGSFNADSSKGGYTYKAGDLVMARASGPDSASAQYFFVTGPKASNLDAQGVYVVFGHVSQGLDILQKMVSTAKVTDPSTQDGTPNPPVTVKTVTITEK